MGRDMIVTRRIRYMLSLLHDSSNHLPSLLQMLFLRHQRDTLRSEDSDYTTLSKEVLYATSKNLAELGNVEAGQSVDLLLELVQVVGQLFGCEQLEQHGSVDVLASSLNVDEPDSLIENGKD